MSMRFNSKRIAKVGGESLSENLNIDADAAIVHNVSIPAAEAGSLSTRTDADTGVITADESGHGITDSDLVDVYWTGGSRRGMTVSSVVGALISVDAGNGDDFPTQGTEVAVVIPTTLDLEVLGTNVAAIALYTEARGQFVFHDAGGEELFKRLDDGAVYIWHEDEGLDNPITGDSIESVKVSHENTSAAKTMKVAVTYDND